MSLLTPNFRDIGIEVNRIAGDKLLRENRLMRSGSLNLVKRLALIGTPQTIINLESDEDQIWNEGEARFHFPVPDSSKIYEITAPTTRSWLDSVLAVVASASPAFPVLIHCTAGKDRTGVVVAAILTALEIPKETIISEYKLSTGLLYPEKIAALVDLVSEGTFISSDSRKALRMNYAKVN